MHKIAITGIGALSACGEGANALCSSLIAGNPIVPDTKQFEPFAILPHTPVDLTRFITRKNDMRQMEHWQRIGVHVAAQALQDAGLETEPERLALDLHLATNGGSREDDMDRAILDELDEPGPALNDLMLRKIRPSYLLSQLPNLLSGNIAVVLGVGGASRTFMGTEEAGVSALETAALRIAHGQSDGILVGGVQDAERLDRMLFLATGKLAQKGKPDLVSAANRNGLLVGSQSIFLVLEPEHLAHARNARIHAILSPFASRYCELDRANVKRVLGDCFAALPQPHLQNPVLSAATGLPMLTQTEFTTLANRGHQMLPVTSTDLIGHGMEAHFLGQVAIAASAIGAKTYDALTTSLVGHRGCIAVAALTAPK